LREGRQVFLDFVTGGKVKLKIVASDDATLHERGARDRQDVWEARTPGMGDIMVQVC